MYQIINDSTQKTIGFVTEPTWIRLKPETGVYVTAKIGNADGIAYKSVAYNWVGHGNEIETQENVVVFECEAGDYIQEIPPMQDSIAAMEDALCEQDALTDERISAIEDALCEMDMEGNE